VKKILGIDTGLSGAMVLIDQELNVLQVVANPIIVIDRGTKLSREYDVTAIRNFFMDFNAEEVYVVIEKTYPRPVKFGGSAAANWYLGAGYMMFVAMLAYGGFKYQVVDPRTWQAAMFKGLGKGNSKMLSYQVAGRLFPKAELTTKRGKVIDGRADALCIAEWGRRQISANVE